MRKYVVRFYRKLTASPLLLLLVCWYTIAWSWVLFTDTLDLAGNSIQGFIIASFVLTINVAISSLIMWQAIRLCRWLLSIYPNWIMIALIPLLALFDYLVAWIPSVFWIGPQGRLDSLLPLGSATLLFIQTPFIYATRIIGFFGFAGFLWLFLILLVDKDRRRLAVFPFLFLTLLSLWGWHFYKKVNGVEFKATIISETINHKVPPVNKENSDLVVYPEYGLDEINSRNLHKRLERTESDQATTYFLGSLEVNPEGETGHLNRMVYGNSQDGITWYQDKFRLIPGGEDLPYILRTALRASNQKGTLDYFSNVKSVIRSSEQLQPFEVKEDVIIGAAVCSSIISPQDYREFSNNNATVLSNSASLTIFKGSVLFAWQQKSLAKFMAVANSRYFLQSANSARAYALDNNGNTLVEINELGAVDTNIKTNSDKTVYTLVGEWLVSLGVIILLLLALIFRTKLKKLILRR